MVARCLSWFSLVASIFALGCGSNEDSSAGTPPAYSDAAVVDTATDGSLSDTIAQQDAIGETPCIPKTCVQLGAQCGTAIDGCGNSIECGSCAPGQTCGGGGTNKCGSNECVPKTCAQLGASCGQLSDGCTSVIDCGWCKAPDSCGGGGIANQCGCTCELPNAVTACVEGGCSLVSCVAGWDDCNGQAADGCEADLMNDPDNCGACLEPCAGNCIDGVCDCHIPCGVECCTATQKCCPDTEICVKTLTQCSFPR